MKNILISTILLMLTIPLLAEDWLTIYNNDLSLVRNRFELELVEGRQDINYSDITSRIDPASVIVTGNGIRIAEQNYEYDLAGKWQIMAKYLDREVLVITKDQSRLTGILKFYSDNSIGIIEKGTDRLLVISESETQWIQLAELPENFYTKPTLHWNIIASKKGKHPVQMSYLTGGFSWDVTYNTVWDEKTLQFNSWVTINNTSGKAFNDVNLKLIAGDINQVYSGYYKERKGLISYTAGMAQEELAPSFDEKAFLDFHMYTLDQKVSFANNQTKQLELYPSKNIKAYSEYEYPTYATKIKSMIKFKNTAENGAGMPLPKGIIKVYKQDSDGNLEFIGEDSINHTSKNEEVSINTGTPFDLIASTRLKEQTQISKYITESLIQVTLRNNSDTNKTIKVTHQLSPNTRIVEADYKYTKDNNDKVTFSIDVAPDKEIVWTFRQRSE
ncbi:MAG: DUF4139 domain-containing protein [Candidatus Cloacimonetes bacterium]|nr:DUF4139 domain-containing protein [Candidatus Cloacimonadota bacterium]